MLEFLGRPAVRVVVVTLLLATVQGSWLTTNQLFDTKLNIMLLAAVCAGIAGGAELGALSGFVYGLAYDVLVVTPFGTSALAFGLAAYAFGMLKDSITVARIWWLTMVLTFWACLLGVWAFSALLVLVGYSDRLHSAMVWPSLVIAVVNALGSPAMERLQRWVWQVRKPVD